MLHFNSMSIAIIVSVIRQRGLPHDWVMMQAVDQTIIILMRGRTHETTAMTITLRL